MPFAFNPDDGPARLMRYRPASEFPDYDVLATLDRATNTLTVNKDRYEELSDYDRRTLLRTQNVMEFARISRAA